MNAVLASKLLICMFVGSVTLWYIFTPYLIQPHPDIVAHVLARNSLKSAASAVSVAASNGSSSLQVENWTKWRVYVAPTTLAETKSTPNVIYGGSMAKVKFDQSAVMNMEWRSDYHIHIADAAPSKDLSVSLEAPSSASLGIYNHFVTKLEESAEVPVVRIIPRFLFGLSSETVEEMYGTDVSALPVVGVFTDSPRMDRILIQSYMSIVIASVMFLLYANNPPHAVQASLDKKN